MTNYRDRSQIACLHVKARGNGADGVNGSRAGIGRDDAAFDAIRPTGWDNYVPQSDSDVQQSQSAEVAASQQRTVLAQAANRPSSLLMRHLQQDARHNSPSIAHAVLFSSDPQRTRYRTSVDVKNSGATEWDKPHNNKRSRV